MNEKWPATRLRHKVRECCAFRFSQYINVTLGVVVVLWCLGVPRDLFAEMSPAEVEELKVDKDGSGIMLKWAPVRRDLVGGDLEVVAYRMYSSTDPAFVPDQRHFTNAIDIAHDSRLFIDGSQRYRPDVEQLELGVVSFFRVSAVSAAGIEGPFAPIPSVPLLLEIIDPPEAYVSPVAGVVIQGQLSDRTAEVSVNESPATVVNSVGDGHSATWRAFLPLEAGRTTVTAVARNKLQEVVVASVVVSHALRDCMGVPEGARCEADSRACTEEECHGGICMFVGTNDLWCRVYGAFDCVDGACVGLAGDVLGCQQVPDIVGGECSDGIDCTIGDRCIGGVCLGTLDSRICDADDSDCVSQECAPGSGGADARGCRAMGSEPAGSRCEDGVACTDDYCDGGGVCVGDAHDSRCPNSAATDADGDCARDGCSPGAPGADSITGCLSAAFAEPIGARCDDGFSCTTEICGSVNYPPYVTCQSTPHDEACNAAPQNSDPDDDCEWNACRPGWPGYDAEGCVASFTVEAPGSPCSDGFSCTTEICGSVNYPPYVTCQSTPHDEACNAAPQNSDPDDDCEWNACRPGWPGYDAEGCVASFTVEAPGSPCSDGFSCTTEICGSVNYPPYVTCQSTPHDEACNAAPQNSDPDDDCEWNACRPGWPGYDAEGCVANFTVEAPGSPCSDGFSCTTEICGSVNYPPYVTCQSTPHDEACNAAPQNSDPDDDCEWNACRPGWPGYDAEGCVANFTVEAPGSPCSDGFSCTTDICGSVNYPPWVACHSTPIPNCP